tara:strand:- start:103 stop:237 length:135 start_codon:yes stop_codon:yes gene_type:complete
MIFVADPLHLKSIAKLKSENNRRAITDGNTQKILRKFPNYKFGN